MKNHLSQSAQNYASKSKPALPTTAWNHNIPFGWDVHLISEFLFRLYFHCKIREREKKKEKANSIIQPQRILRYRISCKLQMLLSTASSNQCYIKKKEKKELSSYFHLPNGQFKGKDSKQSLNASLFSINWNIRLYLLVLEACAP